MSYREHAIAIANQFQGRCTCTAMDGGVDCPWCQVFYDVLQGHPVNPPLVGRRSTASLSTLG